LKSVILQHVSTNSDPDIYRPLYQFGFKASHSIGHCTQLLKKTVKYYTDNEIGCFIDFSKACDKMNYWKLFIKLLDDNIAVDLVALLAYYSAPVGMRSIVINPSVCVRVCLSVREHRPISGTASPILTKFRMHVPCGRGSVRLWRRCATLCTSGFMDNVTFSRNGRDAKTWRTHRAATAMNHGRRDDTGAESDVYECLLV